MTIVMTMVVIFKVPTKSLVFDYSSERSARLLGIWTKGPVTVMTKDTKSIMPFWVIHSHPRWG